MTIQWETTTIFHTYYAWEVSYNFEVGEFSEAAQKVETRSIRLHVNNMLGQKHSCFSAPKGSYTLKEIPAQKEN